MVHRAPCHLSLAHSSWVEYHSCGVTQLLSWMHSGDGHVRLQQPASTFAPLALSINFTLIVTLQENQSESHPCPTFCKLYGLAQGLAGLVTSVSS